MNPIFYRVGDGPDSVVGKLPARLFRIAGKNRSNLPVRASHG
jgi:hypothetical protein